MDNGIHVKEVLKNLKELKISFELLNQEELIEFKSNIPEYEYPYWKTLKPENSYQDSSGWKHLDQYFTGQIYLFFEEAEDPNVFKLDIKDLASLIGECYLFSFYITDLEKIVGLNQYEFIITKNGIKNIK